MTISSEVVAAFIGLVATIVGVLITAAYYRGRMKTILDNLQQDMDEMRAAIGKVDALAVSVEGISRDHVHLDDGLKEMTKELQSTKTTLATLNITMEGVQTLLQNIFDGKLKMARQ